MKLKGLHRLSIAALATAAVGLNAHAQNTNATLLAWNNLGMHCMDSDYSVFSILPPYNTVEAQLIVNGSLVKSGTGYTVTYEAIADPAGSLNTTSVGKTTFWTYAASLYGNVAPDTGLLGWKMPGKANAPQAFTFETSNSPAAGVSTPVNWFRAEGIPITPYDDTGTKNYYPMMHVVARNASNAVVATTDVVLPVSDEMDCRACHASNSAAAARPAAGWANVANAERDYRLNILRLHDEREFAMHPTAYASALSAKGYNSAGLFASVTNDAKPVLCAACHASEALPGSGISGIPPLTASVHSFHASVMDPVFNTTLGSASNRAACYRCHPGSTTKCLRGAMGSAVASNGTLAMQCQNCHGGMSVVGASTRTGWFQEPNCQSCHTGTASHNNGQIRYTSAFTDGVGTVRVPVDTTFATSANTPASGLSLYRFSTGHGGLQCSACHGSTHAEFPSSHANDNVASIQHQGHMGPIAECSTCHTNGVPNTVNGGPHGMHPIGQSWVSAHGDRVESTGIAACQACHGTDNRGTVLSMVQGDRTLTAFGTKTFYRGATIGCYTCHNGPSSENANNSTAPSVTNTSASTAASQPVVFTLPVSGNNAVLSILTQPAHGLVGVSGTSATYTPDPGYAGVDSFTFAAYDGAKNSTPATATVKVATDAPSAPAISSQPASQSAAAGSSVTFTVQMSATGTYTYQWAKDGVAISGATSASYTISSVKASDAGNYTVTVTSGGTSVTSQAASLTVSSSGSNPGDGGSGATTPSFSVQPVGVSITPGQTLVLFGQVNGSGDVSYQWYKNGVAIPDATDPTLKIEDVTAAAAGSYTLVATNAAGSTTSAPAVVSVGSAPLPKFLSLSVRTEMKPGKAVTAGINVSGEKAMTVLVRAAGPALQAFGVTNTALDPQLTLYNTTTGAAVKAGFDDDWDPALAATFSRLGAFAYGSGSKDAALLITLQPGLYTAEVTDKSGQGGEVLVEVYMLP